MHPIDGFIVGKLVYNDSSISFEAPFEANDGKALYKFNGILYPEYIKGILSIEYADSTYNKKDTIELEKLDSVKIKKFKI
jgi:hypothetical protein